MEKVGPFEFFYDNLQEFRGLRREIFDHNSYYFETDNPSPVIIDLGAHVGLSTLYFKKLYPESFVVAVEPNPASLSLLKQNISHNRIEQVEVLPVAVSDHAGEEDFFLDASDDHWYSVAGFTEKGWDKTQESMPITVETIVLDQLIDAPVDFVKMDIEGAERKVLLNSPKALEFTKHLLIEYHPIEGNSLEELHNFLTDMNFSATLYKHREEISLDRARGLIMIEAIKS